MGDPVQSLSKTVHPEVAGPKLQQNLFERQGRVYTEIVPDGIVKLKLTAVFDAQHGGFTTGWSPVSWGSIDELFVNLTMPAEPL